MGRELQGKLREGARGAVRIEREGAIGWLIFDHLERRNAITVAIWEAIPGAIAELDGDPQIRVIVLRGAGDLAFVSGADISEFETTRTGENAQKCEQINGRAFAAIASAEKPVIAMIYGFCVGGGTRRFRAWEAMEVGLINAVVPKSDL